MNFSCTELRQSLVVLVRSLDAMPGYRQVNLYGSGMLEHSSVSGPQA